jgi:Flp pilus assembly pilin Flp
MQLIRNLIDRVVEFHREDSAQDTFEYMLIIGGVTVAVIGVIVVAAPSLLTSVKTAVCNAVKTIPHMSTISC